MALVDLPFSTTFTFARAISADCRDRAGALVTRAPGAPRFDHDDMGIARGLLITAGPAFGQHDNCRVRDGDWDTGGRYTLLHEIEQDEGLVRRALYTLRPRLAANACLRIAGRHRLIGAVADFLPNLGGYVRYRAARYELGGVIATETGVPIGDAGRPLIES